ncbi:MAG: hypothetical protein Q7R95_03425, partial [bacterium]|nr:hypothetical protein [bacterium]
MILFILPFVFNKSITIKNWMIAGLIAFMVSFPVYFNFITVQQLDPNNRASSQLWFSTGQFLEYLENKNDSALKKYVKVFTTPVYSYLDHFGFDVNFTTGADLFNKNSPLDAGWFLLSTMPLIFFGIKFGYIVFGKWWKFLLVWWLLCPIIPATTGSISLVRNLPFIVPSTLIMAGGFIEIWRRFVKWRYVLVILFLFNFWMFYMAYFIHYPVDSGNNFQYGYKQAWEFIKPNIDKYNKVVVEDRFGEVGQYIGVPHLYFGYFGAFSVDDMQNRYSDNGLAIGKFRFKYVDWNQETYMPKTVYIVSAINPIVGSFRDKFVKIGVIKNLDYKDQFLIYESIE